MDNSLLAVRGINHKYIVVGEPITGLPMLTYVAMGLQDGKTGPGWYNGYNNSVYVEHHFLYDVTKEAAWNSIRETVKKYPADITAAVSFFVKKVASQWNNPTYSSLYIIRDRIGKTGLDWLIYGEKARSIYIGFTNLVQTWIFAGCFLYALLRLRKCTWQEVLLPLAFIGGFLFHLFWEAKNLYAISYLLLLLPLCVWGYREWAILLKSNKTYCKKKLVALVCFVLIWSVSDTEIFRKTFARNDDDGIFNVYTQEIVDQDRIVFQND